MAMGQGIEISGLKASSERIGKLYPVLMDKYGNIIDGTHRLGIDENWPKVKLEHIETEEQLLMARLVGNVCRRIVPHEEKSKMLAQIGEMYLKKGIRPGEIAYRIAERTGMSYRWVMKYMPARYKARAGAGGPSRSLFFYKTKVCDVSDIYKSKEYAHESKVECFATPEYEQLLSEPKQRILKVRNYGNTDFVNLVMERRFYARLDESARKLGVEPEAIISNVFLLALGKLEKMLKQERFVEAGNVHPQSHC